MREPKSLKHCLFNAWANANNHFCNPQEDELWWAIDEGLKRMQLYEKELLIANKPPDAPYVFKSELDFDWKVTESRKDHECIRCGKDGIKSGDYYYKHSDGSGSWSGYWKMCVSCIAMILYFNKVWLMPVQWYTHWDYDKKDAFNMEERIQNQKSA